MPRIVMEHIQYEPNVPPQGADGDKMFFVQVDAEKCIGCDTCQEYCPSGAIYGETGAAHEVAYPEACINCGQCLTHCPEFAVYEVQTWVPELQKKLQDKSVKCIAMPAPSVRYALGEAFGLAPGSVTTGKMLSALKALGFAHCWDTEFTADVTIWEEASEFVQRLGEKKASAPIHILLSGLAEVCGNLSPRPAAALFLLQIARGHERQAGQNLRRGKAELCSRTDLHRVHHALHCQKI